MAITPELKKLSESVLNLRLPDHQAAELFAENVQVRCLGRERRESAAGV